jgi:16S rRNA (cytosine967-C5)-methyltransferase
LQDELNEIEVMQRRHLAKAREVRSFAGQDMFGWNRLQRFGGKAKVHGMAGLVLEIDRETAKYGIDRRDFSEAPASVHAITPRGELDQGFDLLPGNLSRAHQLFKLFSHTFLAPVLRKWHFSGMSGRKPREIAVRILQRRERGEDFVETIAEKELAAANVSGQDRGLAMELAYGCVRRMRALDFLIDRKTQGRQQKPQLQILLRLGLYQIFFLDRVPEHAAVHETVELAKVLGFGPQAGFINAVLRGYVREQAQTEKALADLEQTNPAVAFSHPDWLWARWSKRWGMDQARALLKLNNAPPPVFARANTLRGNIDALTAAWQSEGVDFKARQFDWSPLVFELVNHSPLASLPSFQKGLFYLQDPSTLLAPKELGARSGETILDMCAAPGGKSTYIAQLTSNQATILAEDNQPARLSMVKENVERLGAKVEIGAAAPDRKFDRILIDAPCSNTGVLRRRVDLRWRIKETEVARLSVTQLSLLEKAVNRLKPSGTILYSTCSLEPEENQEVIRTFLSAHSDFRLERERELFPFRDGVDGAYVAALVAG